MHLSDALIRNALVCTNLIFIKLRLLKILHNPPMRWFPIVIGTFQPFLGKNRFWRKFMVFDNFFCWKWMFFHSLNFSQISKLENPTKFRLRINEMISNRNCNNWQWDRHVLCSWTSWKYLNFQWTWDLPTLKRFTLKITSNSLTQFQKVWTLRKMWFFAKNVTLNC